MPARGYVQLECDGCGADVEVELGGGAHDPETIDQAIDFESWEKRGVLLDRLLCEECAEKEPYE